MWTRLSSQYIRSAAENQHVLQQAFFEYQFQPSHDVMTHITEIELMATQLEDIGAPVTAIQVMSKIICTLPPSFRNFTTSWDSVPAGNKNRALLTSRLLKEEAMNKRWTAGVQDATDAAFFARNFPQTIPPPPQASTRGRGRGGRGFKSNRGNKGNRASPYVQCSYCKRSWHTIEACSTRFRDEENAKNKDRAAKSTSDQHQPQGSDKVDHSLISTSTCFTARCHTDWFADSGATQHMSDQASFFTHIVPVQPNSWHVTGIGDARLSVHGYGNIVFITTVNGVQRTATIEKVLYVPGLGTNLLSIAAITDAGVNVQFIRSQVFFTLNKTVLMEGERIGRKLYHLAIVPIAPSSKEEVALFVAPAPPSIEIWHQRFAHASYKTISKMHTSNLVEGLILNNEKIPDEPCLGCAFGKMTRSPFPVGRARATQNGQLIHSDLCGPMHVASPKGARYFILFTDDHSGWRTVFFLKHKSEAFECFKNYAKQVHMETGNLIHTLRADNGGEFVNNFFQDWLAGKGIRLETSAPHSPEQNGVSERANRTIVEGARSLLHAKRLPLELWAEAIACTVYTLNRVSNKASPSTPYFIWHGSKADVSNLRIFGSTAFIHVPKAERHKLDSKSIKCYFVGYSLTQKAYRFWIPATRKIKISRDVIFDEHSTPAAHIQSA